MTNEALSTGADLAPDLLPPTLEAAARAMQLAAIKAKFARDAVLDLPKNASADVREEKELRARELANEYAIAQGNLHRVRHRLQSRVLDCRSAA